MRWLALRMKRLVDLIGSALLVVIFSPVLLLAALVVRTTMGSPVLFRQPRIGHRGREFTILKFRTMADTLAADGSPLPDEERLTTIGKLLRKTTIDELPELINVLRGQMSLVGPRPLLVEYLDAYTPTQMRRHDMPPGMAGPVLSSGRNALDWDAKFERDVWYVDNWSLWLDAKIFVRTAMAVLRREGVSAEGHATMPRFTDERLDPDERDEQRGSADR